MAPSAPPFASQLSRAKSSFNLRIKRSAILLAVFYFSPTQTGDGKACVQRVMCNLQDGADLVQIDYT